MRARGPSLIVCNTSSCTPQAWDMQLGYIHKPTSMQSHHIQTFTPCYMNSHTTHVHTQETLCNQRAATAPICSQLLDTHKPMSMKNPARGPVDTVDIHAHISPPGMQIPRKMHICAKVGDCTPEYLVSKWKLWSRSEHNSWTVPQKGPWKCTWLPGHIPRVFSQLCA